MGPLGVFNLHFTPSTVAAPPLYLLLEGAGLLRTLIEEYLSEESDQGISTCSVFAEDW